jgi:segregation and condensation protein A
MSLAELYLGPPSDDDADHSTEPRYHVRLPVFDGPLDLLLHLIRKNEVDIYDIPIAPITKQYLDTLELMRELNLNVAGDFVFMAATLIHIKSKMLLPPPHEDGTEDDALEDPRAELVARLIEYQRYKDAAQMLHQRQTLRDAMWLRSDDAVAPLLPGEGGAPDEIDVDLFQLLTAFRSVLERVRQRRDLTVERETISVERMIEILTNRVPLGGSIAFENLFEGVTTRALLVVTFVALLEMVRLRILRFYQNKPFGPIHVSRRRDTGEPAEHRTTQNADRET